MARVGRKRKPAVARQPNGRSREGNPSPTERREAAVAVVLRQRVAHGATFANAADQRHATNIGRWFLAGRLGVPRDPLGPLAEDRYLTAIWYADLHRQMRRAIEARDPHAGAPGSRAGGGSDQIDLRAYHAAMTRHRAAEIVIPRECKTVVWRYLICEEEPGSDPRIIPAIIDACDAMSRVRLAGS